MDTRTDRGDFYPGGETGGSAPAPQQSDKVDRVNLGEVGESYTLKDVKQKVNQIVRVIAPAANTFALMLYACCHLAMAATAPLEEIPNTSQVVTNEEDSVALATLATATNALKSSTLAMMSELRSDMNNASNNLATAIGEAIASESNRVEATYAKRSEIPTAPDLSPYALKSEIPANYLTEGDITNFATRAWINSQGYATEGRVYARIDAQNLALGAATNEMWQAMASGTNRLWEAQAAASNRLNVATNAVWTAMANGTNRLWQTARSESNRLDRTSAEIRDEIAALELTGGMTRLWTSDAKTYQDATGVVWQVQVATSAWTVVQSWTTNDVNWVGPFWWGEEGAGEDYYEGPGWYISSSGLTTMKMSEDIYESQIVMDWTYWGEEAHSITTTCSRTVQWLTNAVNRVAYTNELAGATNAVSEGMMNWVAETLDVWGEMGTVAFAHQLRSDEEGVENVWPRDVWAIARNATNYTDAATNAIAGAIGRADLTEATNYTDSVAAEFEYGSRIVNYASEATSASESYYLGGFRAQEFFEESTNAARAVVGTATNGLPEAIGRKQDRLPYPTNAIPYAAISGAPSGGQEWRVVNYDVEVDAIYFVTNGMANLIFLGGEIGGAVITNGWPDGASMFVRGQFSAETSYTFGSNVHLVGYGTWPTNNFQSVWWRSGTKIFVNVLLEE